MSMEEGSQERNKLLGSGIAPGERFNEPGSSFCRRLFAYRSGATLPKPFTSNHCHPKSLVHDYTSAAIKNVDVCNAQDNDLDEFALNPCGECNAIAGQQAITEVE